MSCKFISTAVLGLVLATALSAQSIYPGQFDGKVKTTVATRAQAFDLKDVRLTAGRFRDNLQRDSAWLMSISADRLLHSFRTGAGVWAGLEGGYMTVHKLGGWESLDCELRGHTTGHILSASALLYAATGSECFKAKGDSLVSGLKQVQRPNGYLGAFPEGLIDRNIKGQRVWAPWYTLHKILAGLIDQYLYAGNADALQLACGFADWAYEKLHALDEDTRRLMLRNEFGGMPEAFWNLYSITSETHHKFLTQWFYHNDVLDPLFEGREDFGTKHTNTFIPKVIALAREYEITRREPSRNAAEFFWHSMVAGHCFAPGCCSDKEHFFPKEKMAEHISGYTGETCCTYNMLKLTRHLFCWEPGEDYALWYENALINHILGQQDPQTGMVAYFLPLKSGSHKVYSTPENSFWCCVGSGFENHAKYAESIYYHSGDSLWVNLMLPSELSWKAKGMKVVQQTSFPESDSSRLRIECGSAVQATILLRCPQWCSKPVVKVNGRAVKCKAGEYAAIRRKWKNGDEITLVWPKELRIEKMASDSTRAAIFYGPVLLAARAGTKGFQGCQPDSDPRKYNDYYKYDYHIPSDINDTLSIEDFSSLRQIAPLEFETADGIHLSPLYDIHRERYIVYWNIAERRTAPAATGIPVPQMDPAYPRMTKGEDSPETVSARAKECHKRVDKYVDDPQWMVGRLQMYWDSHATEIYVKGEKLDHVAGRAPVPTVRYTASRGTQTIYSRPSLEDTPPCQDSLGMWMMNKTTGKMEWADPRETGRNVESMNMTVLKLARDAAYIHWAEGDERYARFASEILDTYLTGLYYRDMPVDIAHTHQQTLVGLTSFEVIHEDAVLPVTECFDLLHDYLASTRGDKMEIYNGTFRKWADVIIRNGVPHNNWNLIQARFVLQIAMVLPDNGEFADGRGRNWYINEILNGNSIRQWSIGRLIEYGFDAKTGLWKESPGYASMVIGEFDAFADLLYRMTGEDLVQYYPVLDKAVKALPQYLMPNGLSVCWGDGHYGKPKWNFKHLKAVREEDYPEYQTPLFWSEGVSWFAARSGEDQRNALMMSVCGSQGNHMHANGISLELYGKGQVMAPDLGRGSGYSTPDYLEFYSQFPAHNTVCVDGVSSYPVMESHHPVRLVDSGSEGGIAFGEFSFTEPETMSDQLRQVVMVNTRPGAGYYVDIFRSRRQDGNDKFHDYFYHNIGQEFTLDQPLEPTGELAFAGACLYAYSYLWDKFKAETSDNVQGRFTMHVNDGSRSGMAMWMKWEKERTVYKVLSPAIDALTRTPMPYDVKNSPCQTFVARQRGEAWTRPFVAVYQPFADGDELGIAKVEYFGKGYVGVKVTYTDGQTDYIFSADRKMKMEYEGISVEGVLCVVSSGQKMLSRCSRFEMK